MKKFLLVFISVVLYVVSVTAQVRPLPTTLDDYILCGGVEGISSELIQCGPNSNISMEISIHRNYGIPRFGVIVDCNQNVDTVVYISSTFNKNTVGGINSPLYTDTAITIWWKEGNFDVKIMDVLTGNVVLDGTHSGQSISEFGNKLDTLFLADSTTFVIEGDARFKKSSNPGVTINYANLPNGLYWIYIVSGNTIYYMKTLRKGV